MPAYNEEECAADVVKSGGPLDTEFAGGYPAWS